MNIPFVNIFKIHKEFETYSAPFLCTCTNKKGNFENYYVKFILNENEYCGLVYEIVCNQLAKLLNVNTPAIAFVNSSSIVENNEKINKNYLINAQSICFASKEISKYKMISDADIIKDKTSFNKFLNPEQFFKISIFDLWVSNSDRSNLNYNLLVETTPEGYFFYAIDHFHCFGGNKYFNKDFSTLNVDPYKSILTSTFGQSLQKYLDNKQIIDNIVETFNNIDSNKVNKTVENVFSQLPKEWKIDNNLQGLIISFLTNKNRNNQVIEVFKQLTQ